MALRRFLVLVLTACASLLALPGPAGASEFTSTAGASFSLHINDLSGRVRMGGSDCAMLEPELTPVFKVVWSDGLVQNPTPVWTRDPSWPSGTRAPCTATVDAIRTFPSGGTYTVVATSTRFTLGSNEPLSTTAEHTVRVQSGVATGTAASLSGVAGAPLRAQVATIDSGFFSLLDPDRYLTIVAWGDSTRSLADQSITGGLITVTGEHVYAAAGVYELTVTLVDTSKGTRTTFPGTATIVAAPAPTVTPTPAPTTTPTPTPTVPVPTSAPVPVTVPAVPGAEPEQCVVPQLVGLKLPAAKASIAKAGCRLGKVTYVKAAMSKVGRVVRAPKKGNELAAGARIALKVGK